LLVITYATDTKKEAERLESYLTQTSEYKIAVLKPMSNPDLTDLFENYKIHAVIAILSIYDEQQKRILRQVNERGIPLFCFMQEDKDIVFGKDVSWYSICEYKNETEFMSGFTQLSEKIANYSDYKDPVPTNKRGYITEKKPIPYSPDGGEQGWKDSRKIVGSTHVTSDTWAEKDKLGHDIIAESICEFLRHTEPPLTISIHAPWGAGKTSVMRMVRSILDENSKSQKNKKPLQNFSELTYSEFLKELKNTDEQMPPEAFDVKKEDFQKITVWFNAWKYENNQQVWAGLADAIIRQITDRLTSEMERTKFWIRVNRDLLQAEKIEEKVKKNTINAWINKSLKWIAIASLGAGVSAIEYFATQNPLIGIAGTSVSAITGALTSLKEYFTSSSEAGDTAIKHTYKEFLHIPDYTDKLGLAHNVEQDIEKILKVVPTEYKPIIVFIDDLDRCSPEKVVEIIEALNRFISTGIDDCVFVLGMDTEMIVASLESAYASMIKGLSSYSKTESLGWKFMDKFIQLPITLPSPTKSKWQSYLQSILKIKNETLDTKNTETGSPIKNSSASTLGGSTHEPTSQSTLDEDKFIDEKEIFDDDKLISTYCNFLAGFTENPREIKRIINVLRFQTLVRQKRRAKGLESADLDEIVNWMELLLKWPDVESWITRGNWFYITDEIGRKINDISARLVLLETFAKDKQWSKNMKNILNLNNNENNSNRDSNLMTWTHDIDLEYFFATNKLSLAKDKGLY